MARIQFSKVTDNSRLRTLFDYIKHVANSSGIREREVRGILGDLVESAFIDIDALRNEGVTDDQIIAEVERTRIWDFESWIDALNSANIAYEQLTLTADGGSLEFEQLSWPSGGIEATEEIIKIFGGEILANNAE